MGDRSTSEIRTRINELRELIESGVKSTTVDGTSVNFDLATAREQLRTLEEQLPENKQRRPRAASIDLSGSL